MAPWVPARGKRACEARGCRKPARYIRWCPRHAVRLADALFGAAVRAAGSCARCGSRVNLQCAHVISRRYRAVRWRLENAVCLCARCHIYFSHRPLEWEVWVKERNGARQYESLKRRALTGDPRRELVRWLKLANRKGLR